MKNIRKNNFDLSEIVANQSGVTLIEALVTLLVLSVGALGIASMQLAGLKYTSGAYGRTQAVILADDMANRLKSNRAFALNFDENDDPVGVSPYELLTFDAASPAFIDCRNVTIECSDAQLVAYDIVTWRNELARVLPSGRGSITTVDTPNVNGVTQREFLIGVQWRQVANSTQELANQDDELQNFTFRILL